MMTIIGIKVIMEVADTPNTIMMIIIGMKPASA